MKTKSLTIDGTTVTLQFVEAHEDHVGFATHEVKTSDMDEGAAGGPWDNQTFTLDGETYRLGEHDYEPSGDNTICTARVYREE